jgi:hypothetical protein
MTQPQCSHQDGAAVTCWPRVRASYRTVHNIVETKWKDFTKNNLVVSTGFFGKRSWGHRKASSKPS